MIKTRRYAVHCFLQLVDNPLKEYAEDKVDIRLAKITDVGESCVTPKYLESNVMMMMEYFALRSMTLTPLTSFCHQSSKVSGMEQTVDSI